jgi:hypothetical protein
VSAPLGISTGAVLEISAASVFGLMAVRSFIVWRGREFRARSMREQVLYAVHVGARVGLWLAFAALFLGYALVDRPREFAWFIVAPMGMAGLQLITGLALGRDGSLEE